MDQRMWNNKLQISSAQLKQTYFLLERHSQDIGVDWPQRAYFIFCSIPLGFPFSLIPLSSFGYGVCKVGFVPTTSNEIEWKWGICTTQGQLIIVSYVTSGCVVFMSIIQSVIIRCRIFTSPYWTPECLRLLGSPWGYFVCTVYLGVCRVSLWLSCSIFELSWGCLGWSLAIPLKLPNNSNQGRSLFLENWHSSYVTMS